MLRKIIKIDEEKCNGCGLCAQACHEGAIAVVDGKAKLLRDDYCDGLGNCLPVCPVGAISFEEREATAYDEKAVAAAKDEKMERLPCGCPGTHAKSIERKPERAAETQVEEPLPCGYPGTASKSFERGMADTSQPAALESELSQWPVQMKLVPVNAPYFQNANLLVAADCTAFAYGDFHRRFIKNHVTLVGYPKLDGVDYTAKLTEIIKNNSIKSVKVVRMEVPCCAGLEHAVKAALQNSGKFIPWQVVVLSTDGKILED